MALPFLAISAFSDEGLSPQQMENAYNLCLEQAKLGYVDKRDCACFILEPKVEKISLGPIWEDIKKVNEKVLTKMQEDSTFTSATPSTSKPDTLVCKIGEHKALNFIEATTKIQDQIANSNPPLRKRDKVKQGLWSTFEKFSNKCK